ncbi:MAG TPA: OmpW family outer membrane protein [Thermoanaerobaculia bacterium]|nr:OmpW family outer membrane protein [Thermoanaerobaculia bacterium]
MNDSWRVSLWGRRAGVRLAWGLAALSLLAAGPVRSAEMAAPEGPTCRVDTKVKTAKKLGGPHALVKGGVNSRDQLANLFADKLKDDVACLLASHGLERLAEPLAQAASGSAVVERDLASDECFDWMSWRGRGKNGKPASGPLCLKPNPRAKKQVTYGAFVIPVDEMISEVLPEVRCQIQASGDAAVKPPSLKASIDGSTPGATASWTATNGTSGALPGSGPWQMEWKDLCTADYTFTVHDTDQGTQTWVTHTFLVPKICGNISYAKDGQSAPRTVPGKSDECTESVEVKRFVPPPPVVTLDVAATSVSTRVPVSIKATAESVCLKSCATTVTDGGGELLETYDCPTDVMKAFTRPDIYSVRTHAVDAIDQTGDAGAVFVRVHPRWTVRGFVSYVHPKDERVMTSRLRTPTLAERTAWGLENGWGIGGSVERRFTEVVGLEGGLLLSRLQSSFKLDLNGAWEMSNKKVGLTLLTLGPNFHLLHDPGKVDLYIGPFLGYAIWSAKSYGALGESHKRDLDDGLGFGLQLGIDAPIHRTETGIWAVHGDLRYLDLSTDVGLETFGKKKIDVNPLILSAGISYSF